MTNRYIQILSLIIMSFTAYGQKAIENIRTEFRRAENQIISKEATLIEIDYECPDMPENGNIKYYTVNEHIIKISFDHGYEHGGYLKDYYLKNDQVYFAFITESQWHFDGNVPNKTWDLITEHRIYFQDEKPIRCLFKHFKYSRSEELNPASKIPNEQVECDSRISINVIFKDIELLRKLLSERSVDGGCIY